LLETKDPDGKIISIDVVGADGKELHASSRGSTGGREMKMVKIDLSEKPPADAALAVTVRTAKSLVTVSLNLKGISLAVRNDRIEPPSFYSISLGLRLRSSVNPRRRRRRAGRPKQARAPRRRRCRFPSILSWTGAPPATFLVRSSR